jgi:hypothetical protein
MSLSRPNENTPNPAVRWFDWHGEKGVVCYYDKDKKQTVEVPLPFLGIVLDQLSAVRGWDDSTKSGIFSNAVRDTREEVLTVKSFKGGVIAEGRYKEIKAQVNAAGGHFETQVYIAFKRDEALAIGVLSFKGAALRSWMEFVRAHRAELQSRAVKIVGVEEGQNGRVKFKTPVFAMSPIADETMAHAVKLDEALQSWLDGYFKRNQRTAPPADEPHDEYAQPEPVAAGGWSQPAASITDDDIPF